MSHGKLGVGSGGCKKLKVSESCSVASDSLQPHGLYNPWNSPGQNTGVGILSFLQGMFPTQGSNPGLPHCIWILYQLSHKGSPWNHVNLVFLETVNILKMMLSLSFFSYVSPDTKYVTASGYMRILVSSTSFRKQQLTFSLLKRLCPCLRKMWNFIILFFLPWNLLYLRLLLPGFFE